jgi:hypothetical protein
MNEIGGVPFVPISKQTPVKTAGDGMPGAVPDPKDVLIKSLEDENATLKARMEEMKKSVAASASDESKGAGDGKITFDVATGVFTATGLKSKDMVIDRLKVRIQDGGSAIQNMMSLENLTQASHQLPLGQIIGLKKSPMEVQDFRFRLPQSTSSAYFRESKGQQLKEAGVEDVGIEFNENNRLKVSGTYDGLLPIPFSFKGGLSTTEDHKIRLDITKMSVMGFIPVPRLIQSLVMAIADDSVQDPGIQREGRAYIVNPKTFVPPNVKFQLNGIKTEKGALVLEGGAPGRE